MLGFLNLVMEYAEQGDLAVVIGTRVETSEFFSQPEVLQPPQYVPAHKAISSFEEKCRQQTADGRIRSQRIPDNLPSVSGSSEVAACCPGVNAHIRRIGNDWKVRKSSETTSNHKHLQAP